MSKVKQLKKENAKLRTAAYSLATEKAEREIAAKRAEQEARRAQQANPPPPPPAPVAPKPPTARETYLRLREEQPMQAAQFHARHSREIHGDES